MAAYIARRVAFIIPVALVVSFLTFMLIHLIPGDPARVLLGEEATPQNVAALDKQLGLNQPITTQYLQWLGHALHGNLGQSIILQQPVPTALAQRLPVTLALGVVGLLFSLVVSIPLGVLAASFRNSPIDYVVNVLSIIGSTVPSFVLGLVFILVFAVLLKIFPPGGYVPFNQDPVQNLRDLIMPAIVLGSAAVSINMRQVRANMLEILHQDYIRTARAKGLTRRRVLFVHALRNALLPLLTIVGIQVGAILGGTFIVESIFLWPGIGSLAIQSILAKDYPVVQGVVLLSALAYMTANLLVDIGYGFLDPRISYASH